MAEESTGGWFEGIDPADTDAGADQIRFGTAEAPASWPQRAIATNVVPDEDGYYDFLHRAASRAVANAVNERAAAADEQLKHRIRILDDLDRLSNELAERIADWTIVAGIEIDGSIDEVISLTDLTTDSPTELQLVALAGIVQDMRTQREAIRQEIERTMHDLAPNLTAIAGALLGARLIALAGDLESLAKSPSGTVQVLGAEDALFAHLNTGSPPPKHGIIYTHEYVRGTSPANRGSAARALAGKLSIAARIDYYSGDPRPELERQLQERIDRIRRRDT